jgi:hypothetical protein
MDAIRLYRSAASTQCHDRSCIVSHCQFAFILSRITKMSDFIRGYSYALSTRSKPIIPCD